MSIDFLLTANNTTRYGNVAASDQGGRFNKSAHGNITAGNDFHAFVDITFDDH